MTTLTFLGHAALLVEGEDSQVIVDPFLTDSPVASMAAEDVRCTHVALTHGHEDHVGDTIAIAKANDATLVAAYEICNWAAEEGHANISPGNPGGRVELNGNDWIALTRAYHSSSYHGRYMGQPCGLVLHVGGHTIYHAGDTDLFSDMRLIGELYKPEVALLPVGDRFTMGPELASIAANLVGAPKVVPIHHGTWPPIEVDLNRFQPEQAQVCNLQPGDQLTL